MTTAYAGFIEEIAQAVFATMLNMELYPGAGTVASSDSSFLAMIQLSGDWQGSVVLDFPQEIARAAASAMLGLAPEEVTIEDEYEVAAELTNMIGGNTKSVLPGQSFLSLPTIVSGQKMGLVMRDTLLIDDVVLVSEFGPVRVRLYAERTCSRQQNT